MSSPIPAFCSASEFTQSAWPFLASRQTGLRGAARSSGRASGKAPLPQTLWFHPDPVIHAPAGLCAARAATRETASSSVAVSTSTARSDSAYHLKCRWASVRPGQDASAAQVHAPRAVRPSAARAPVLVPDGEESAAADGHRARQGAALLSIVWKMPLRRRRSRSCGDGASSFYSAFS